MPLNSTVGGSTANSYVSRSDANAYFQLGVHPRSDFWHTLEDHKRDQYLVQATNDIESQRIDGYKYTDTMTSGVPDQRLKFPRREDYDDGAKFIPAIIKIATYEQALYRADIGRGSDTRARLQAQGVTSASLGDVSETYDLSRGRDPRSVLAPNVRTMLLNEGILQLTGVIVG